MSSAREVPRRVLFQRRPVPAAASTISSDSGLKMEDGFDDAETGRRSPPRLMEFYGDDAASVDEGIVPVDFISHVEECGIEEDEEGCECNEEECVCDMSIPSVQASSDEDGRDLEEEEDLDEDEDLEEEEDSSEEDSDEDYMNVSDDDFEEGEIHPSISAMKQRFPSLLELGEEGAMMWQDAYSSTGSVVPGVRFDDEDLESVESVGMKQNRLLRRQRRLRRLKEDSRGSGGAGGRIPTVKRECSPTLQLAFDVLGKMIADGKMPSEGSSGRGSLEDKGGAADEEHFGPGNSRDLNKSDVKKRLEGNIRLRGQKRELGPKVPIPEPSFSLQNVSFEILGIDSEGIFTVYAMDDKLEDDYERLTRRMLAFYSNTPCSFTLHDDDIHVGMVVAAEVPEGYVARAVVKNRVMGEFFGEGAWKVDCMDERQTCTVPAKLLYRIPESFLALPRCKMTCELFGLEFFSGQYQMMQEFFEEFVGKKRFKLEELRANIYIFSDYNALEILKPEDDEEEEEATCAYSGFFDTVNKAFARYLYKILVPKFRVDGPLENAQFLRFNTDGMAVFQCMGRQLDMVTKLGGCYLKTLNSLNRETLQSLMKDYFEKYTYIHVIKTNEFQQVQFQRFKVVDVLHKKNQVFADLVDSGDRVCLNIGDGIFRADQIHESLVKIPPMIFKGHISKVDSGHNAAMIAAYLKPKSIKVKLNGYYENGKQEFQVFVYNDDMRRSLMDVTEWMKMCKVQDYLKEMRL